MLIRCVGAFSLLMSSLAFGTEIRAQETGGDYSHWEITPSVSLYQQYSDNVDLTPEGDVSAFITEFSPGLMFRLPSSRNQIRINTNLKLDYRQRSDGSEEALSWYNVWGYYGRQHSPRTSYEVSTGYDIYYTDPDLSSPFINVFDALSRSDVFYIQPGLSHNINKTTTAKLGLRYSLSTYESSEGVDGEDIEGSLFLSRKIGSRILLGTGYIYRDVSYENETGFVEQEIPINIDLDLTYIKLKLNMAYVTRDYEDMAGSAQNPLGSQSFFFYGVGFELGGQVLKLRSTVVELNFNSRAYDDLGGFPYINQEIRLALYHAFKKFDFYSDLKYGVNDYVDTADEIIYWGAAAGLKWYITDKVSMNFSADYTVFGYEFDEITTTEITSDYDLITTSIDLSYSMYDWLFVGLGYGHRESGSSQEEGNYSENSYSIFAKATW